MTFEQFLDAVAERIIADDLEILGLGADVHVRRDRLPDGGVGLELEHSYDVYDERPPVTINLSRIELDAIRTTGAAGAESINGARVVIGVSQSTIRRPNASNANQGQAQAQGQGQAQSQRHAQGQEQSQGQPIANSTNNKEQRQAQRQGTRAKDKAHEAV